MISPREGTLMRRSNLVWSLSLERMSFLIRARMSASSFSWVLMRRRSDLRIAGRVLDSHLVLSLALSWVMESA